MTEFDPFTAHPGLAMFPLLEGHELMALVQDIKREGLRQPIVLNHDRTVLIDGRNRYLACLEAGVDPVFEYLPARYTDVMIVNFIASANLRRRHATQ